MLEQAGLKLSPAKQLTVQQVLNKLGGKYLEKPEHLERILGPVIVKNESEQDIFQQTFRKYLAEIKSTKDFTKEDFVAEEEPTIPDSHQINQKLKERRQFLYIVSALALAAFLIIWSKASFNPRTGNFSQTKPSSYLPQETPENLSTPSNQKRNNSPAIYGEEITSVFEPSTEDFSFEIGHGPRHVISGERFNFVFEFNHKIPDLEITCYFGDGNRVFSHEAGQQLFHTYADPGIYTVEVSVRSSQYNIFEVEEFTFPVYPAGTSYSSLIASDLAKQEAKLSRIKWQVFFLAFFMILAIEGYLERYKQKQYTLAFRQYFHRGENAPYTLPYEDMHEQLQAEPGLYSLADSLKKRSVSSIMGLDVKRSLYETVQAGGFPQLIYAPEKTSSEYLILIDESGPSDHQAMLFEQLIDLLKKEEVPIQQFRFRNDPRFCYNEEYPDGIELDLISKRNQADRLLIFGKGSFFLNLRTHQLADWTEESFSLWRQKVLLTPEPKASWGFREKSLQKEFVVLAADLESQQGIVEALLGDSEDLESLQGEALASSHASIPLKEYDFENKEDLQAYLGDALYKWLMASMVSHKASWAMTMKVGKALEESSTIAIEGNKLVSYDNLLKLSRIPWLQAGEAPHKLKTDLLKDLDEETEQIARHAVLDLLKQTHIPTDSLAYQEKLIEKTVQGSALAPENKDLQQKLRFLWQNNMLNQSMRGVLPESFGTRIMDFFARHQRALAPAIIGTLIIASFSIIGVQFGNYSDEALLDKHFENFPARANVALNVKRISVRVSHNEKDTLGRMYPDELFDRGVKKLKKGEYTAAIEAFDLLKIDGFGYEIQQWYQALALLGNGQEQAAKEFLYDIQKDPNNLYYFKAIDLLNDLNSYWRF